MSVLEREMKRKGIRRNYRDRFPRIKNFFSQYVFVNGTIMLHVLNLYSELDGAGVEIKDFGVFFSHFMDV